MSWCSGWLSWWGSLQRGDVSRGFNHFLLIFMAPRKWGFNLKTKTTNYPDHGHHWDPPPTRKIPMVEAGIETGTSWLVVRSSDHQTTRLVGWEKHEIHIESSMGSRGMGDPVERSMIRLVRKHWRCERASSSFEITHSVHCTCKHLH
jgi:hypothetical protein